MRKLFLLFLSLLSTTSLSQAMEKETREIKPHVQPKLKKPSVFKTLPLDYVGTYNGRSNLGSSSGISYPKIPTIHTDEPNIQYSPFGAVFLGSEVSIPPSLKQYLPQKDQFFFLNVQVHDKNEQPLFLKPQYALFPDAPARSREIQEAELQWTVISGAEGKILPEYPKENEIFLKETVSIRPRGEDDPELILAPSNSMRLQGIELKKSMDCYSFINADNASLVTYHWMLTPPDFKKFNRVLRGSHNLNELIYNLESKQFLPNLLKELKQYVQYDSQNVQPKLKTPFTVGEVPLLFTPYEKTAKKGDINSIRNLAWSYINGDGVEQNIHKAIEYFEIAAEEGDVESMNILGRIYINGEYIEQNIEKTIEYLERAAQKGNINATKDLAWFYISGKGVEKNIPKAIEYLERAAQKGDLLSMSALGHIYRDGEGVEKNIPKAIEYLERAAQKGDLLSMSALGHIYRDGDGVEEDPKKATEWFEKAAELGDVFSMAQLGYMYKDGDGVEKDFGKAIEWFKNAAEKGDTDSMNALEELLTIVKSLKERLEEVIKSLENK